jgi:D-alanyl-lipoteichoic acid acyltransferase DltB (MBOAT superfamily)
MLFTSQVFILYFLPLVFLIYVILRLFESHRLAIAFLVGASLFYYAWWDVRFLFLLLVSITINYFLGSIISLSIKKYWISIGVIFNLALICYYKYTIFILDCFGALINVNIQIDNIILPLAISFFTFQQIAYLVDCSKTRTCEKNFIDYSLFVTFFPQLIAGPIVHHQEMLPQFKKDINVKLLINDFALGVGLFAIGLFKKLYLADQVAIFSDQVFDAQQAGSMINCYEAWIGALAYSFQIYFDFSGYTDMAMGAARIFGIYLPINFNSPYRALNSSDFWARWHITLSRFLRDYLYIPLGGNRSGTSRTLINLFITMLLGGLWHGANLTFVVWGGIHGLYLIVYHAFTLLRSRLIKRELRFDWFFRRIAVSLTFLSVVVAWVFFRADKIENGISIIWSMFDLRSALNLGNFVYFTSTVILEPIDCLLWIVFLLFIIFCLPNSLQILSSYEIGDSFCFKQNRLNSIEGVTAQGSTKQICYKTLFGYPLLGAFVVVVALLLYMAPESSPFIYTIF